MQDRWQPDKLWVLQEILDEIHAHHALNSDLSCVVDGRLIASTCCAARAEDSSSDFTEPEESKSPPPRKPSNKSRSGRMSNLFKNGNQGAKTSADESGAAKDAADDDMAASDHFWHGLGKKVCKLHPAITIGALQQDLQALFNSTFQSLGRFTV